MQYKYAENRNFEDYAGGRVFYAQPGQPAFPVRLASEIFQRGLAYWQRKGGKGFCAIYDPTCGGAYWLAVLAYLHWDRIDAIHASDVDAGVIPLAERNLSLLTPTGLEQRAAEIHTMIAAYGKTSHAGALESANRFRIILERHLKNHAIQTDVFQADATDRQSLQQGISGLKIDIVLADVPYGWHSNWQETISTDHHSPIWRLLAALRPVLPRKAVIAIAADKQQNIRHNSYQRLERFQVGKRQVVLLELDTG
jgi:hypothetical protein